MDDAKYWGPAPWTVEDLDGKTIDCNWHDARAEIKGVATIVAIQRPNGDLRIDLTSLHSFSPTKVTEQVIAVPPDVFAQIEEHPNQDVARFKLGDIQ